jgi:hypothetical protein
LGPKKIVGEAMNVGMESAAHFEIVHVIFLWSPCPRSNLTSPIQFSCLRGSIYQPDMARITDITQRGERKEEIASRMLKSQKFLMSTIIPLGF